MSRVYECIKARELIDVLVEVKENHDWPLNGRRIKYVDFNYDNRGCEVFTIRFRGSVDSYREFTAVNRMTNGQLDDVRLFEEVMDWLRSGRGGNDKENGLIYRDGSVPQ